MGDRKYYFSENDELGLLFKFDLAEHDKQVRAKVIEECMDVVPCRLDDGDYSDGFNACSKKVLDRLQQLKEHKNDC